MHYVLIRRLVASLFAGALLSAPAIAAPPSGQPYDVEALLPLTGAAAFVGQSQQKTLEALETVVNAQGGINGRPLHFTIEDNQTSPEVTVQLANAALAKKPALLMVAGLVSACQSILALVHDGPVVDCLSPAMYPPKGSYMFSSGPATADMLVAELRYFRARGWKRIAMLSTIDATGQDADRGLAAALARPENKDVTLVSHEHFAATDLSVSAQIERVRSSGAQVLIAWATGTPFGTVLRAINDAALDIPIATNAGNVTYAQMKQYAGFLPRQLLFPGVSYLAHQAVTPAAKPQLDAFLSSIARYDLKPDTPAGMAWDPGAIAVEALRRLGPDAGAEQLHRFIENLHGFAGISGLYDFTSGNQRGLGVDDLLLLRWDTERQTWLPVSRLGGEPLSTR